MRHAQLHTPLALALACAPAPAQAPAPASPDRPASTATASALPPELAGLVEPWHRFDPAVADAGPVWLQARYTPGTYPCRPGPDGSLDMLRQDRFTIERVVRGAVQAPAVDLPLPELRGPEFPRGWAEGRRYLLFLRPGPDAQARLADARGPGGTDDRLMPGDVAGAIDLDEPRAAAEADAVARRDAPDRWDSLRAAAAVDPAEHRRLAELLQREVLRARTPLAELRARLGPPDEQQLGSGATRREQYLLARPAYDRPHHGDLYGDLRLTYDDRLELRAVELFYLRWRVEPNVSASVALTPEEHARLGLPRLDLRW